MKRKVLFNGLLMILAFMLTGCGEPVITQGKDTFELGDTIKLEKTVEYDVAKVSNVEVINAGNFNTDELGSYDVKYIATSTKGKTAEFIFTYNVIDTVAPELTVNEETIYLCVEDKFDINDYASVKDLADYTINFDGDLNMEKEGEYAITVTAKDSSGNISEEKNLSVVVSDRRDADFEHAFFGDSLEVVKQYEKGVKIDDLDGFIMFEGKVGGVPCNNMYYFNDEGQFYMGVYGLTAKHTNASGYISDYNSLKEKVVKKYGECKEGDDDIKVINYLVDYCSDDAQALELGYIEYWSTWETDDALIELWLSASNFDPGVYLRFTSKTIPESTSEDL